VGGIPPTYNSLEGENIQSLSLNWSVVCCFGFQKDKNQRLIPKEGFPGFFSEDALCGEALCIGVKTSYLVLITHCSSAQMKKEHSPERWLCSWKLSTLNGIPIPNCWSWAWDSMTKCGKNTALKPISVKHACVANYFNFGSSESEKKTYRLGCPPSQKQSPPGLLCFRVGDPNDNLHLPLLLGGGTTPTYRTCSRKFPLVPVHIKFPGRSVHSGTRWPGLKSRCQKATISGKI